VNNDGLMQEELLLAEVVVFLTRLLRFLARGRSFKGDVHYSTVFCPLSPVNVNICL